MSLPPGTSRRSASALAGSPACRGGGPPPLATKAADVSPAGETTMLLAAAAPLSGAATAAGGGAAETRLRSRTARLDLIALRTRTWRSSAWVQARRGLAARAMDE